MAAEPIYLDLPVEASEFFCSNPRCIFHLCTGDAGVRGIGDWATTSNGITVSHRWVDDELYCDLCAAQKLNDRG